MYSLYQRITFTLKRHAVGIIFTLSGLLLLSLNAIAFEDNASLASGGILRVGVGIALILLVTKFAFPSLNIQRQVNEGNIAVAVFSGLVAIAIAILF